MSIKHINRKLEFESQGQSLKKGKPKKKRFKLKLLLFTILVLAIVASLALSPVCNVKRITVKGSQRYKDDQLIGATDIYIGGSSFKIMYKNINHLKNIYSFRYGKSEQSILKNYPYIKEAKVTYLFPNEVSINIYERKPICIIPFLGTYLLMDEEEYVVDTIDDPNNSTLPIVKGIGFDSYVLGQALNVKTPQTLNNAIILLKAIDDSDKEDKNKLFDEVRVIDVTDSNRVYLFVDNRIEVNLGDFKDLTYKLNFFKQIYSKKISREDNGLIDLSTGENPNFIPEKR